MLVPDYERTLRIEKDLWAPDKTSVVTKTHSELSRMEVKSPEHVIKLLTHLHHLTSLERPKNSLAKR